MSRTAVFQQPKAKTIYKDLRHNASEARDYFSGLEPDQLVEKQPIAPRVSKGTSGESSN